MPLPNSIPGIEVVDFAEIPPRLCPCGAVARDFADVNDFPGAVHVTDISEDAKLYYHETLTETYFFLECETDEKCSWTSKPLQCGKA